MTDFKQSIVNIAEICVQKDVLNFIISPGSRSAPLALAFLRHSKITCRTIVDERSAAFIALGLAQQTEKPVGLLCTSGTAALNYSPAVAEAFYQQVPLLIFTADRPPEWIGQNDGQTIIQRELYGKHCRAYFELPVDDSHPDARWHIERIISEAINGTLWPIPGPVHINVPLREPLYPSKDFKYQNDHKIVSLALSESIIPEKVWNKLTTSWIQSGKKLVAAGLYKPDPVLVGYMNILQKEHDVVFLADVTSNCHHSQKLHHFDMILGCQCERTLQELEPDLLLTFGGPVVSKNLKLFLRQSKLEQHWQLHSENNCIDPFQSLTQILLVAPNYFFQTLIEKLQNETSQSQKEYLALWRDKDANARNALNIFLERAQHSELTSMNSVLNHLPDNSHLQLGNSSIVRLANFISLFGTKGIRVNSNRGTNGIDGTVSTAVGAALASSKLTALITGDLAFIYDRNGLWHNYLPPNLRIIIFNNQGGGIFRILDGSRSLPELTRHFEVEHHLTAENMARDHGLDYVYCDSKTGLEESLPPFFEPKDRPAILEVRVDKRVNAETFFSLESMLREIK